MNRDYFVCLRFQLCTETEQASRLSGEGSTFRTQLAQVVEWVTARSAWPLSLHMQPRGLGSAHRHGHEKQCDEDSQEHDCTIAPVHLDPGPGHQAWQRASTTLFTEPHFIHEH